MWNSAAKVLSVCVSQRRERSAKMPVSIEKLPDEPIVMVRITHPLDMGQDVPYLVQELGRVFDASPEQLFDITDTYWCEGIIRRPGSRNGRVN